MFLLAVLFQWLTTGQFSYSLLFIVMVLLLTDVEIAVLKASQRGSNT